MDTTQQHFGARELIAIGIGGMIGGGIFSVLGIAVNMCGNAAPFAFIIAGIIALCTGYSYVKLALALHSDGASFTYLEHAFPKAPNLAGILGWTVVIGYIGTLALYAYTFAIYGSDLFGVPDSEVMHTILAIAILTLFCSINLIGVKETGISEDIVVYGKVLLLLLLAIIGCYTIKPSRFIPLFNKEPYCLYGSSSCFCCF